MTEEQTVENIKRTLELEKKNNKQQLEYKLKMAQQKNRDSLISMQVGIMSAQMKSLTMAMFFGAVK